MSATLTLAAPRAARPRRLPSLRPLRRYGTAIGLVLLWELLSRAGVIPERTMAAPSAVLGTASGLLLDGTLGRNLLVSLGRAASGFALGVAAGTGLALVAGLSRLGEEVVDAPVQMLRTLPFLALVPLFILWFGIGEAPKVALVALGSAFPVYLNLLGGLRGVDPRLVEAGRVFGLGRAGLIRFVMLPGALPSLLVGLRHALGVSWLSLVVAEQINASAGIGFLINDARDFMRTDVIVVGLGVYALLGLGADALVRAGERRALRWRTAQSGALGGTLGSTPGRGARA